jgi:hypothetical protein
MTKVKNDRSVSNPKQETDVIPANPFKLIIIRHLSSNFLSVFLSISSVQVFHVVLNHAIHFNASGSETP